MNKQKETKKGNPTIPKRLLEIKNELKRKYQMPLRHAESAINLGCALLEIAGLSEQTGKCELLVENDIPQIIFPSGYFKIYEDNRIIGYLSKAPIEYGTEGVRLFLTLAQSSNSDKEPDIEKVVIILDGYVATIVKGAGNHYSIHKYQREKHERPRGLVEGVLTNSVLIIQESRDLGTTVGHSKEEVIAMIKQAAGNAKFPW
ncbi:hypothetical protein IT418_01630 [bacterium]|nr:hypothetical protein [bacterium]